MPLKLAYFSPSRISMYPDIEKGRDSRLYPPQASGNEFGTTTPYTPHQIVQGVLLIRGEQILADLFPGFSQDLLAGGARRLNFGRDLRIRFPDGWLPLYETQLEAIATSRRLLDHVIHRRVATIPRVAIKANSEVQALCSDAVNERIVGVKLQNRASGHIEDLPAELVVDASGRSSKAPQWLAQLGFTPPEEQTVNAFPGYSTRIYEIPAAFKPDWQTLYIMPNPPDVARGAIIVPMEGHSWHVSLIGMNRDFPPTDEAGFLAFAGSLVSSEVYEALKVARPLSPIWGYRNAANRLRRFDALPHLDKNIAALSAASGQTTCRSAAILDP